MPPLPDQHPALGLFDNEHIDDEASEGGDADAAADLERIQGLVDSDGEVREVEPPAPLVQKRRRTDGASSSEPSWKSSESAPAESAPKRPRAKPCSAAAQIPVPVSRPVTSELAAPPSSSRAQAATVRIQKKKGTKPIPTTTRYAVFQLAFVFLSK